MSKLGIKGSVMVVSACCGGVWHNYSGSYYGIIRSSLVQNVTSANWNMNAVTSSNSAVRPSDVHALDAKIDNGVANTGTVISGGVYFWPAAQTGGISNNPIATCSVGANYVLTNPGYECTPLIRIGARAGAPQ
jgi:hypothetical protein